MRSDETDVYKLDCELYHNNDTVIITHDIKHITLITNIIYIIKRHRYNHHRADARRLFSALRRQDQL